MLYYMSFQVVKIPNNFVKSVSSNIYISLLA
jgi:hypothetical protein